MASEVVANLSGGDLQVAAEDGRTVLHGPGFYFSFDEANSKALLQAVAVAGIRAAHQRFLVRVRSALEQVSGGSN